MTKMYKELSKKQYNLAIGVILLWGFAINAAMCIIFPFTFATWNQTSVMIGYFLTAALGICMSVSSDNPIVSFAGYNLIVLPIGVVLSISLKDYCLTSITLAFVSTSLITILMIIVSTVKPEVFESMGYTLSICLSGVIIIEFVIILLGIASPQWWDWIVALLTCAYIGYDWSNAQNKQMTLDNAVDSATNLYLDIAILFGRLLKECWDQEV